MVWQHKGDIMTKRVKILKVTKVEVTPQGRTERVLTGEELKQWKIDNGYEVEEDDTTAEKTQSDT